MKLLFPLITFLFLFSACTESKPERKTLTADSEEEKESKSSKTKKKKKSTKSSKKSASKDAKKSSGSDNKRGGSAAGLVSPCESFENLDLKSQFADHFEKLCEDGEYTGEFEEISSNAYEGSGEPQINTYTEKQDGTVTKAFYSIAVKVPVSAKEFDEKYAEKLITQTVTINETTIEAEILETIEKDDETFLGGAVVSTTTTVESLITVTDVMVTETLSYRLNEEGTITAGTSYLKDGEAENDDNIATDILFLNIDDDEGSSTRIVVVYVEVDNRGFHDTAVQAFRDSLANNAKRTYEITQ